MMYLLLFYDDEQQGETAPAGECDALDKARLANNQMLQESGYLLAAGSLQNRMAVTVRMQDGEMSLSEGPVEKTRAQLAELFLIHARDLNEAIRVASKMPQVHRGPIEIRTITMSPDEHKAIVQRYVDELNQRNLAILDELVADEVRIGSLMRTEQGDAYTVTGRAAYREGIVQRIAAFPDYRVTIIEMIAEADQVMLYWRNRGTHSGPFRGVPPTGKMIEEMAVSIYRIHDGKIVEVRGFDDPYDFWQQLEVSPADTL